jgi:hypothetical protein
MPVKGVKPLNLKNCMHALLFYFAVYIFLDTKVLLLIFLQGTFDTNSTLMDNATIFGLTLMSSR